ncbi:MAG: hypothetical protein II916_04555, partial [Oscillospiraceae bacterium]|nr:hypothetical protein [Oscillospiraceae bacterium]
PILLSETQNIDCEFLIGFWNLFTDIGNAVDEILEPVLTKRMRRCYDKLFWGCNVSAIVPEGERYVPHFTRRELRAVRQLMQRGMEYFSRNLYLQSAFYQKDCEVIHVPRSDKNQAGTPDRGEHRNSENR